MHAASRRHLHYALYTAALLALLQASPHTSLHTAFDLLTVAHCHASLLLLLLLLQCPHTASTSARQCPRSWRQPRGPRPWMLSCGCWPSAKGSCCCSWRRSERRQRVLNVPRSSGRWACYCSWQHTRVEGGPGRVHRWLHAVGCVCLPAALPLCTPLLLCMLPTAAGGTHADQARVPGTCALQLC